MKTLAAVESFLNSRRSLNRRPATIRWYRRNLACFSSYADELPTEPEPIEDFLANALPAEREESRHGYYRTLKALYRFICRRRRIPNPMELIDPPTRHKKIKPTLVAREMLLILTLAETPRDKAILSFFIDSGPRAGEAASLRKQHIFDDYVKVDGKSGEREIPISEETRRLLLYLANTDLKSEFVFRGQRGPLTPSGMYQIVNKYMKKANIAGPKLGPHRIRHAFGKNYIKNGGDTRSLQEIMGHANISTTEIYVDLARDEIVAKHHQFTPLRSTHAAAQGSFLDQGEVMKEAERILERSSK